MYDSSSGYAQADAADHERVRRTLRAEADMARTRLQDTALRARDLEQRNHELHAALRVAKHAVLNAPRSPTMIHFEALQKSVSSMEGRHKERERELERMLRGLEDRRDAEMHALKRKVRRATTTM